MSLDEIRHEIINSQENSSFTKNGLLPLYSAHKFAKILIIGQAPGRIAQSTGTPWNDKSGDNLRMWLGLSREEFYDKKKVAIIPMDSYFPGSKEYGDIAPRKGFAQKWHPQILKEMPHIKVTILIGKYSQELYLGDNQEGSLTGTVKSYKKYLPKYFPIVHPSPRNNIWLKKNPWFGLEVIPSLQNQVKKLLL